MNPTKEMIEAVEYMADTGKCNLIECENNCPFHHGLNEGVDCDENGFTGIELRCIFDKTLQTSAKNWLKENGVK